MLYLSITAIGPKLGNVERNGSILWNRSEPSGSRREILLYALGISLKMTSFVASPLPTRTSGKPIIPRLKRDELGINAVSVTLIQQQPQTSTRKPRHCTVCKQPMKGHKNVTNCPRNQPPAEWWTSLTASLWSHLSILFWAFWCPSLCMLSIVQ